MIASLPCDYSPYDELKNKGYQYWALGHVHQYEVLCDDPWIVFPGNLQGLHINEPGAKGAVIVEIENGIVGRLERLCVALLHCGRTRDTKPTAPQRLKPRDEALW